MFTLSNIIVIFIVIVILFVYRRFDTTSRNYAKITALLREAQSSMEALVQSKIASLRDVGIEVDAQRKAAQTILSKAKDIGETISSYESKIHEIQNYIGKYESLLPQLMSMTQSVEKNMTLIQDESEYVDGLGKRLGEHQKRLHEVEQVIPKLIGRFEAANTSKMKEVELRFLSSLEAEVSSLREVLESTEQRVDVSESKIIQLAQDIAREQEDASQKMQDFSERMTIEFGETLEQVYARYESRVKEQREVFDGEISTFTSQQSEQLTQHHEEMLQRQQALEHRHEEKQEECEALFLKLSQKRDESETLLTSFAAAMDRSLEEKKQAFSTSLDGFIEKYAELVAKSVGGIEQASKQGAEEAQVLRKALEAALQSGGEDLQGLLKDIEQRGATILSDAEGALDEIAKQGIALKSESMEALQRAFHEQISAKSTQLEKDLEHSHGVLLMRIEESQQKVSVFQSEVDEKIIKLSEEVVAAEQNLTQEINEIEEKSSIRAQASVAKIEQDIATQAQSFKEVVETRIHTVKTSIEQYYDNLHSQFESMQEKTNSWRGTLEEYILKLEQRLTNIDQEFQQVESQQQHATEEIGKRTEVQLQEFQQEYQQVFESGDRSIQDLKERLNAMDTLMQREEDRVTSELTQRTKTLFTELSSHIEETAGQTRTSILQVIDTQLSQYESDFNYRISKMENITADMDSFEHEVQDFVQEKRQQLFASVQEVEARILNQHEVLQKNIDLWKHKLDERCVKLETMIEEFRETTQQNLYEKLQSYDGEVDTQLEAQRGAIKEKISSLHDTFDKSVASFRSDFSIRYERIQEQLLKEVNQKMSTVHANIFERMTEGEGQVNELRKLLGSRVKDIEHNLHNVDEQITENIVTMKKEFYEYFHTELSQQKTQTHQNIDEWKGELTQTMGTFKTTVESSLTDLVKQVEVFEKRVREEELALESRSEQYTKFLTEYQTQSKEDIENLLREGKEEFLHVREGLITKLEQDLSLLSRSTEKIEKKQKLFLEHTKLFDRVDTLKQELEQTITVLKGDMEQLKEQRKWLRELGAELGRMQRIGKETDQQFARFLSEKRRIDMLEANYNRLVELSYAVEQNLQIITSKDDEIQTVNLALKNISELGSEVEERFARLENKKEVLDFTIEGVQKNFSRLSDFDEQLDKFSVKIEDIPQQIQELSSEVSQLMEQEPQITQAVLATDKLDLTINELEKKIEKLQVAREWIAGVETRLNELNLQVDTQLRAFQQLVKEELVPKGDGAPPKDARRTVIQLSRQGWNVEEISRVTKISRGEIELILEMSDRA